MRLAAASLSGAALAEIVGHVDQRERPLVRVSLPDRDRSFLALVDTGFNGWLFMEAMDAVRLGFVPSELTVSVEFAGRGQSRLRVAHGHILWFGKPHHTEVLVSTAEGGRAASPDELVALLGTRLLSPHFLKIDFAKRRVSIESAD
jgi:predicted aspartyl protease